MRGVQNPRMVKNGIAVDGRGFKGISSLVALRAEGFLPDLCNTLTTSKEIDMYFHLKTKDLPHARIGPKTPRFHDHQSILSICSLRCSCILPQPRQRAKPIPSYYRVVFILRSPSSSSIESSAWRSSRPASWCCLYEAPRPNWTALCDQNHVVYLDVRYRAGESVDCWYRRILEHC